MRPLDISASVRFRPASVPLNEYLNNYFPDTEITSVFGFLEPCVLYGGRIYNGHQLIEDELQDLKLRLPLTNHYVSREDYENSQDFLAKYHKKGNAAIVVNDNLAKWIKEDFPLYEVEASCIKNIDTLKKLNKLPDYYDSAVLPPACVDDTTFLEAIEDKSRIRLFYSANCAYTCPAKTCYKSISKINKGQDVEFQCSQTNIPRHSKGLVKFNIKKLAEMGFSRFKAILPR